MDKCKKYTDYYLIKVESCQNDVVFRSTILDVDPSAALLQFF
jgi:hypothetical protein